MYSDEFRQLEKAFTITSADMKNIAQKFSRDIFYGLNGQKSSLKMLPSFLKQPTGQEKGEFLAIDFGGTNVRLLKIALDGQRGFKTLERVFFPLKDPLGAYDYTSAQSTAANLFDFIAVHLKEMLKDDRPIFLGHTFSFACRQKSVNEAILIRWAKELETSEAEGRDVGEMLLEALKRAGLRQIRPAAIINDTAATLLSAAYQRSGADIASICGTGHNTCYLENKHPLTNAPMIVNMESGNFDKFPRTVYDEELDRLSEKPSFQVLEKACSGHYLGEILRLVAQKHFSLKLPAYSLKAENLAQLLALPAEHTPELAAKLGDAKKLEFLRQSASLIIKRSARLVAATFAGTLLYLDSELKNRHVIAIDGSLYEKMPLYAAFIRESLTEFFGAKACQIETELVKDGSGLGAAIAAATVCGNDYTTRL